MNNPRITPRDRNRIKGALRRAYSQSELHKKILNSADLPNYSDPARPRVRKWSRCPVCQKPTPKYLMRVDHKEPVIPTNLSFEEMSLDLTADRMWCPEENQQPICPTCHDQKSALEREERKAHKAKKTGKILRKKV